MFDRVATPRIDLYNGITNEYQGRATFPVNPSVESGFLGMINSATIPESIVLQNVTFFPSSSSYVPPGPFVTLPRKAVFHAEFRDADSKLWFPADIFFSFDSKTRGNIAGDKYHFDSVDYTNIKLQDIKIFPQGQSPKAGTA